jgi:competence protein ComEA
MAKGRAHINLARVLIDGEQIDVGALEEPSTSQPTLASGGGQLNGSVAPGLGGAGAKVSLNKATAAQLEQLPRVGPVMASKIIEFRTQHGGFRSVDQLREVPGIGDATFAQIAPHVAV